MGGDDIKKNTGVSEEALDAAMTEESVVGGSAAPDEMSMDEVLASIRKIIASDDDTDPEDDPLAPAPQSPDVKAESEPTQAPADADRHDSDAEDALEKPGHSDDARDRATTPPEIVKEDEVRADTAATARESGNEANQDIVDDDVLELTQEVQEDGSIVDLGSTPEPSVTNGPINPEEAPEGVANQSQSLETLADEEEDYAAALSELSTLAAQEEEVDPDEADEALEKLLSGLDGGNDSSLADAPDIEEGHETAQTTIAPEEAHAQGAEEGAAMDSDQAGQADEGEPEDETSKAEDDVSAQEAAGDTAPVIESDSTASADHHHQGADANELATEVVGSVDVDTMYQDPPQSEQKEDSIADVEPDDADEAQYDEAQDDEAQDDEAQDDEAVARFMEAMDAPVGGGNMADGDALEADLRMKTEEKEQVRTDAAIAFSEMASESTSAFATEGATTEMEETPKDIETMTEHVVRDAPSEEGLISKTAAEATASALGKLQASLSASDAPRENSSTAGATSLEGLAMLALKPMIKAWVDENLPSIVEKIVQEEIKKIVSKSVK